MGAMEGRGRGSRAIAWPDTVDALLTARFFCTVRSLALPRGFAGRFFPSLQAQVHPSIPSCPSHSQSFRSHLGKTFPCGSNVQRDFKHQLLLPSVVTAT